MNKFTVVSKELLDPFKSDLPLIYKVYFGDNGKYYIHKGKNLEESLKSLLYTIDRGLRSIAIPPEFDMVTKYLKTYPAIHKVKVKVVFNGEPDKIIASEKSILKECYKDANCFNDPKKPPYTPQWIEKVTYRCKEGECLKSAIIAKNKQIFKFCPNCGNRN